MPNRKLSRLGNYIFDMLTLHEICAFNKPDKIVLFVLKNLTKVLLLSLLEETNLIVFDQKLKKLPFLLVE